MKTFEWVDAVTISDVLSQAGPTATIKAGGVDVMDQLKEHLIAPQRLVNIRRVPTLDRLTESAAEGLRIGPLVTLATIAANTRVKEKYTALAEAAGKAATPQIRNMATAAGNLAQRSHCWYFRQEQFQCRKKGGTECFAIEGEHAYHSIFDNKICAAVHPSTLATPLVALGATVDLATKQKTATTAIESLFVDASKDPRRDNTLESGQMITQIRVPSPPERTRSAYMKLGEKESYDWPLVEVAVVLQSDARGRVERATIVLGALAHRPLRATGGEQALLGKTIDEASARAAAQAALKGATPLPQNAYKVRLATVLVRRAILAAGAGRA